MGTATVYMRVWYAIKCYVYFGGFFIMYSGTQHHEHELCNAIRLAVSHRALDELDLEV